MYTRNYSIDAMYNKRGSPTYTCYTDSVCINVTALGWTPSIFLAYNNSFSLDGNHNN